MRYRKLRIAWSVLWGLVAVLTCVLWVRSYSISDTLLWRCCAPNAIRFHSRLGQIRTATVHDQPQRVVGWSATMDYTALRASEPAYYNVPLINGELDPLDEHFEFASGVAGVPIPSWCLAVAFAALSVNPWLRWRFSLRTLLIATTLVALLLGIIVWSQHR